MKTCSITGCTNKHIARGLCDNHYRRLKRNGDPLIHVNQPWGEADTIRADGYIYITRNGKQVMKHRWIMEQHIKRALTKEEIIHHIDGNKLNNKLDNLVITTLAEHKKLYHKHNLRVSVDPFYVLKKYNETVKRED